LFSATLQQEKSIFELALHESLYDLRCTVGASIIYHEYVEKLLQAKDGADDVFYVFLFVVRRNYDDTIRCLHYKIEIMPQN
jgi:hypothetical protein